MLVLTRKKEEQIVIHLDDQEVIVQVVAIDRDRVRLGVIAPRNVAVHRDEVLRRIEGRPCADGQRSGSIGPPANVA